MNSQIEYLCQLQEVDLHIRNLERQISSIPADIESLTKEFRHEEELLEAIKGQAEGLEKERRIKDRELLSAEARLQKYNSQILTVKTNKEYSAMLHEIDQTKSEISILEEDILRLLEKTEEAEILIKEKKAKFEDYTKAFKENKARLESRFDRLTKEKGELAQKKNQIEEKIDLELRMEYQKLCQARRGLAVVRVREGSCMGCNIRIMPQLFQEIMSIKERVFHCPNCGRIIFYKEEDKLV